MMDNCDPNLQLLFDGATEDLSEESFTKKVMKRSRFLRYLFPGLLISIASVLILFVIVMSPSLQEFIKISNQLVTVNLFDLGEGLPALLLDPINNIATLLVVAIKMARVVYLKTNR